MNRAKTQLTTAVKNEITAAKATFLANKAANTIPEWDPNDSTKATNYVNYLNSLLSTPAFQLKTTTTRTIEIIK